jgi:hypothetical protein
VMAQLTEADLKKRLTAMLPASGADELVSVDGKALQKRGEPSTPANILIAISTDLMFRIPSLDLVEAQRDNQTPVYSYIFNWNSPAMGGVFKACHVLILAIRSLTMARFLLYLSIMNSAQ